MALVAETIQLVCNAMETVPKGFSVPLEIDIKNGSTWAECK